MNNEGNSNQYQYPQNAITGLWGYDLNPNSQQQRIKLKSSPITANITLRKFGQQITKSDKIKKIEDEIRALQNERQLMKLNEQAAKNNHQDVNREQKSSIIKMMEAKIQQYNYIIAHHHVTNKKSLPSSNVTASETKSKAQSLLDQIHMHQKQLFNSDIKNQIVTNRKIAKLYRQYKQQYLIKDQGQFLRSKSLLVEPAKSARENNNPSSLKLKDRAITPRNRSPCTNNNSSNFNSGLLQVQQRDKRIANRRQEMKQDTVIRYKEQQFINYKMSRLKQSNNQSIHDKREQDSNAKNTHNWSHQYNEAQKQRIKRYINQPFLEQKEAESFKTLQKVIKTNHLAVHLWKVKVQDAYRNSQMHKIQESNNPGSEKGQQDSIIEREAQLKAILDKNISLLNFNVSAGGPYAKEVNNLHEQKKQEQESIFSQLLKKKNNKFNKMCGTKILVKYNSKEKAKSMLKGQADTPRNSRIVVSREKKGLSQSFQSKQKIMNNIPAQAKEGQQLDELKWLGQEIDEEHYWRMCKNEKINLLLKKK